MWTVHYGHFTAHQVRMAYVTPATGGPRTAFVWKTEEKGSDVNIATFLLLDGHDDLYDEAVVISGDSDPQGADPRSEYPLCPCARSESPQRPQ